MQRVNEIGKRKHEKNNVGKKMENIHTTLGTCNQNSKMYTRKWFWGLGVKLSQISALFVTKPIEIMNLFVSI